MRLLKDSLWLGKLIKHRCEEVLPVYPVMATAGAPDSFCVYRRTSFQGRDTKDLHDITESMGVQVTVVTKGYDEGLAKASGINERLDHLRGDFGGIRICRMTLANAVEEWGENAFLQHLYYEIEIERK